MIIELGKVNDCTIYATASRGMLTPLNETDLKYCSPDYTIKYDSGVYPGVTDLEQYICDIAANKLNLKECYYGWGGKREGSGRPSTGRKRRYMYITDEEYLKVKQLIKQLRKPSE